MPDEYDYFGESQTVAPLSKPKKKEEKDSYSNFNLDVEKYDKTKVKRKTFHYVPKQDWFGIYQTYY